MPLNPGCTLKSSGESSRKYWCLVLKPDQWKLLEVGPWHWYFYKKPLKEFCCAGKVRNTATNAQVLISLSQILFLNLSIFAIQYYICFRYIIQWFDIFIAYDVIIPLILLIICHCKLITILLPISPFTSGNHPFGLCGPVFVLFVCF